MGVQPKFKVDLEGGVKSTVSETQESHISFEGSDIVLEEVTFGTEFGAVKPWLGAIKAPSDFISSGKGFNAAPNVKMSLEYVYGYRVK
jgi:hypothetical protein